MKNSAFLLLIFAFFGFSIFEVSAKCADFTNCTSCAGKSEFFAHCEWCTTSNACFLSIETSKCPEATDRVKFAYECVISPPKGDEYSDDFARTKVLPYIGASNALNVDQIQTCLNNHFDGVTVYKQYYEICDSKNSTCSAFLAVSPSDKAIILSYQGSKGWSQLVNEGVDFLYDKTVEFPEVGGKIDKYYYDGFYTLWNNGGIKNDLSNLAAQYPGYEFWCVGHSMGGSLASVTSALVIKAGTFDAQKVKMVTFGQPRTGDEAYAEAHDNLVPYRYRIVHDKDKVPHLPWQVYPVDQPWHHRFEVWYPNDMTLGSSYKVCEHAEDQTCSDSVKQTSTDHHLWYFNYHLPDWYEGGCKK
jgi:hypothetical protein